MLLPEPRPDQIELAAVLAVLGDRTRLAIVRHLGAREHTQTNCSQFADLTSKTNLTYHLSKLREAGVTRTDAVGTQRIITLRRADLDGRFPGLLDSVLMAADQNPVSLAAAFSQ